MPIRLEKKAREGNTCEILFTLVGNDGVTVVPVGSITTATLTLRNKSDGSLINCNEHNIDSAAAVDKGGGKVGIPVSAHGYSTGEAVIIIGTTNYDDNYVVDADSSTNEVVVVATYAAETFAGTETIHRYEVNIKSNFDDVGKFFMVLAAEDNPIVSSSSLLAEEIHIATIKVVANNGVDDIVLVQNIWITVENLKFVPSS